MHTHIRIQQHESTLPSAPVSGTQMGYNKNLGFFRLLLGAGRDDCSSCPSQQRNTPLNVSSTLMAPNKLAMLALLMNQHRYHPRLHPQPQPQPQPQLQSQCRC